MNWMPALSCEPGHGGTGPFLFGVSPFSPGAIVEMKPPDQYREFAAQCYRFAADAKTEGHQKMMEKMALA
jgi:hypothetical protein